MRCGRRFLLALAIVMSCAPAEWGLAREPGEAALMSRIEQAWTEVRSRYTSNRARPARTEIVPLQLQGPFSAYERALVVQAVRSWNTVLNGFARFEVGPDAVRPASRGWTIVSAVGSQPSPRSDFELAVTQPEAAGGGVVVVYLNRLGGRDLAAVVLHELGHVLGLPHESDEGLMSAYYSTRAQSCVDRGTVVRLAGLRKLPFEQLNWCETQPPVR